MKTLIAAALLLALASPSHACTLSHACMNPANSEVVAALRKQFPDLQHEEDIVVFDNGQQRYDVAFYTTKWHWECRLTLKPVKLTKCHTIHG